MKRIFLAVLSTALAFGAVAPPAQGETLEMNIDEIISIGREWLDQNTYLDTDRIIEAIDPAAVRNFWRRLQRELEGEYVIDLARLRREAYFMAQALEQIDSARPYAAWLQARLDYFDVAEKFRLVIGDQRPTPERPRPMPTPQQQRRIWQEQIEQKPVSVGAQHYVNRLKPVFKDNGIPPELIWIAEVESSFNPNARSPVGALGLFQFMPATAEEYGLNLTPIDERRDPDKSAVAAARYLRNLHRRFECWPLALAAYNAGQGRVARALRETRGSSFDDIAPALPTETQMYVPKIEASIMRHEGRDLRTL